MPNFSGLFDVLKRRTTNEGEKEKKDAKNDAKNKINFDEINKNKSKFCVDGIALLFLTKTGIIKSIIENEMMLNFYIFVITPSLVDEIDRQKKDNESEANYILNLIKAKKISVENVYKNKSLTQYGLYNVELEVVSHFLNGNCNYIISDDAIIRANREILKLKVISTPAFMLHLFDKGIITKEHAISAYAVLRNEKWFEEWLIDECIRRVKSKN